jgi:DNA-binding IclR family transcriptional regulator
MAERPRWTFLTSHASVLLEVAREPEATVREIAERAGLTERQAHRVLADLVEGGYLQRERVGRRTACSRISSKAGTSSASAWVGETTIA